MSIWSLATFNSKPYIYRTKPLIENVGSDELITCWFSNFEQLWSETLTVSEIEQRAKGDNPYWDITATTLEIINKLPMEERPGSLPVASSSTVEHNADTNSVLLNVKYYVNNAPFRFHWNLSKSNNIAFFRELTFPLLECINKQLEERANLIDTIKKKDAEIAQYVLEGAVLTRQQLQTDQFDESKIESTILFNGSLKLLNDAFHPSKCRNDYVNSMHNKVDNLGKNAVDETIKMSQTTSRQNLQKQPVFASKLHPEPTAKLVYEEYDSQENSETSNHCSPKDCSSNMIGSNEKLETVDVNCLSEKRKAAEDDDSNIPKKLRKPTF